MPNGRSPGDTTFGQACGRSSERDAADPRVVSALARPPMGADRTRPGLATGLISGRSKTTNLLSSHPLPDFFFRSFHKKFNLANPLSDVA